MRAKCGVQCPNSPANFGLSPSSTPPESRGGSVNKRLGSLGVNHRDAHAYLQLFGINIRFAMKKIDQLYFNLCFVFSKGKKCILRVEPDVKPMRVGKWGILHHWALGKLNSMYGTFLITWVVGVGGNLIPWVVG